MKYWAGFKDGKLHNEAVSSDWGDFLAPCLYVNKAIAQKEITENKKFDEIRRVEVTEIKSATTEGEW